jgi:hypothetical protein
MCFFFAAFSSYNRKTIKLYLKIHTYTLHQHMTRGQGIGDQSETGHCTQRHRKCEN